MITHRQIAEVIRDGYRNESGHTLGIEWFHEMIGGEVVVTFRGSGTWNDWLRNLLAVPYCTDRTGCGHMGFIRAAERAVTAGLAKELHRIYGRDRPFHCAGHSKGVESAAFAEILYSMGFNIHQWVGFGCPRMWLSADPFPFPATVYAIGGDIVTMVSPWMHHRAERVQLERGIPGWLPSFREHGIDHYMERL